MRRKTTAEIDGRLVVADKGLTGLFSFLEECLSAWIFSSHDVSKVILGVFQFATFLFLSCLHNYCLAWNINPVGVDKIIEFFQHLDEATVIGVGGFFGSSKEVAGLYGLKRMFFSYYDKFVDKLLFLDVSFCLCVVAVIRVNPHAPLIHHVNSNQVFLRLEAAKDVEESFEAYQHFLEKVKSLRKRHYSDL